MIFTIDPYYDVSFFNRTLETLKNNKVPYEIYVDSKTPYHFYIECPMTPVFLDFDVLPESRARNLVSLVQATTPSNDYVYLRRPSHSGQKGYEHYSMNDTFKAMQRTKQGIIFTQDVQHVQKISKDFPRPIWYMGRYVSNSYRLFQSDSLMIKNFLQDIPHRVLQESSSFSQSTELEQIVNYRHFQFKDRIIKLDITPKFVNGRFIQPPIRNEYGSKFLLA